LQQTVEETDSESDEGGRKEEQVYRIEQLQKENDDLAA
jgi:hypothetical protein